MSKNKKKNKNVTPIKHALVVPPTHDVLIAKISLYQYPKYDLFEAIEFVNIWSETDEQFISDVRGWERRYDPSLICEMKKDLLTMVPPHYTKWVKGRWRTGLFDSVDRYFVIQNFYTENLLPLVPGSGSFVLSGCRQPDPVNMPNYMHPDDLCYVDDISGLHANNGTYLGWREKLDGSPMYKIGDTMHCCGLTSPFSGFTSMAEYTNDGCYQLFPYSVQSETVQSIVFKTNLWCPMSQNWGSVSEGVCILTPKGERRLKRFPSVALEIAHGVWEVESTSEGLVPLRPRCKPPSSIVRLSQMLSLDDLPTPLCLNFMLTQTPYPTSFINGVSNICDGTMDIKKVIKTVGDINHWEYRGIRLLSPSWVVPQDASFDPSSHRYLGVKAFYQMAGECYLYKDVTKKYDMIGGVVEPKDPDLETALRREIKEESGVPYTGKCTYVTTSTDGKYTTVIYSLSGPLPHGWMRYNDMLPCVPWAGRLVHALSRMHAPPDKRLFVDTLTCTPAGYKLYLDLKCMDRNMTFTWKGGELERDNLVSRFFLDLVALGDHGNEYIVRLPLSTKQQSYVRYLLNGIWGTFSPSAHFLSCPYVQTSNPYKYTLQKLMVWIRAKVPDG